MMAVLDKADALTSQVEQYFERIRADLAAILREQQETVASVVRAITESIRSGGVVHIFGAGHSQLMAEEVWYRSGQLAPIHPIFDQGLWPHNGPHRSTLFERLEGYGYVLMERQDVRPGEILIVVSNSGRNAVPIEVALAGKERGLTVVALTAMKYSQRVTSRHSSGKRLFEAADLVLDNRGDEGETAVRPSNGPGVGPTTTVINAAILNAVLAQVAVNLSEEGGEPPVFQSANLQVDNGRNLRLMQQYAERIPLYRR